MGTILDQGKIDSEEFEFVEEKIEKQLKPAEWWRNSCVIYFQQFSKIPIPAGLEKPEESLEFYEKFDFKPLQ